jgi:hypothetical protein
MYQGSCIFSNESRLYFSKVGRPSEERRPGQVSVCIEAWLRLR